MNITSMKRIESSIHGAWLILLKKSDEFSLSLNHMGRGKGLSAILTFRNDSLVKQVFSLITFPFSQVNETA